MHAPISSLLALLCSHLLTGHIHGRTGIVDPWPYQGVWQRLPSVKRYYLDVQQGDFFALLGPNGAGKSTTLGVVCSLVQKTAGKVSIFGIDIDKDFAKAKYQLGVVPQEFNFNQFEKVLDIVLAQAGYYGMKRSEALPRASNC